MVAEFNGGEQLLDRGCTSIAWVSATILGGSLTPRHTFVWESARGDKESAQPYDIALRI